MTEATRARLPQHLRKYIVEQNYARYTPEDQAVWRYILRQLKSFLSDHAHPVYLEGLKRSGLHVDTIPHIDQVDAHLEAFGWGAVPVSGFIPPAAFMEFQAIGVLPIACDMRSLDHLLYTPAPDIVHEAAGHAPILVDPEYAAYLRQYGEVARRSIISKEDIAQYEAIRILSDLKEDPSSTSVDIRAAEANLEHINQSMRHTSEAALLSRMNWWTAEYGLIMHGREVKIFGAGLLSSVGEARACLDSRVKKIPLSIDCVDFSYDITEPQPHLFVARDFAQLGEVLGQLAECLAFRRGGVFGLERAIEAGTVNSVQLNSGIQISGQLTHFIRDANGTPAYLEFAGSCQLSYQDRQIEGQGIQQHAQGFSTPVGRLQGRSQCLSLATADDLAGLGLRPNARGLLKFASGVTVEGRVSDFQFRDQRLLLISWQDCRVTLGEKTLFDPAWGTFDMAVGDQVVSVFGGPADRDSFGTTEDFVAKRIPNRLFSHEQKAKHEWYQELRQMRVSPVSDKIQSLMSSYLSQPKQDWLMGVELLELGIQENFPAPSMDSLKKRLAPENFTDPAVQQCVRDGVAAANRTL